jgi:hypothetical protein
MGRLTRLNVDHSADTRPPSARHHPSRRLERPCLAPPLILKVSPVDPAGAAALVSALSVNLSRKTK